jgi:hypothetical protein
MLGPNTPLSSLQEENKYYKDGAKQKRQEQLWRPRWQYQDVSLTFYESGKARNAKWHKK